MRRATLLVRRRARRSSRPRRLRGGGCQALVPGACWPSPPAVATAYAVLRRALRAVPAPFRLVRSAAAPGLVARYASACAGRASPTSPRPPDARCTSFVPAAISTASLRVRRCGAGGRQLRPARRRARRCFALDAAARLAAFPDLDGDAVSSSRPTARCPPHAHRPGSPHAAARRRRTTGACSSSTSSSAPARSELRVVGRRRPRRRLCSVARRSTRSRPRSACDGAHHLRRLLGARARRARLRPPDAGGRGPAAGGAYGVLAGAPAVARVGLRTLVATSERVRSAASADLRDDDRPAPAPSDASRARADPTSRRSPPAVPTAASTSAGPAATGRPRAPRRASRRAL